jgi:hypothetical protein
LALVLVISEFSRRNAEALEALRSWAHENFQKDPAFLHSVGAQEVHREHSTVMDAFCSSLFDPPRYLLEEQTLVFLQHRIAAFHETKAYQIFRNDYFDSFGLDHESASLLAHYESERGHEAVDVLLSVLFILFAFTVGTISFFRYSVVVRSTRGQRMLAFFWFSTAVFYIIEAWTQNDVSVLVSSMMCAFVGLYIRRPIAVSFGEDKGLSFRLLVPERRAMLLATWATVSFVAIQVFNWLHTGTISDPDPITLFISSLTGDFLHEPVNGKRYVLRITGAVWLLLGLWTAWSVFHRTHSSEDTKALAGLNDGFQ